MSERCDIADLLPDTPGTCPACATSPRTEIVLDAWDELRALTDAPEPEPFVLPLRH